MGINRVNISGNLTRDPELRRTQSDMAVLGFGVAVNDRRKNQRGEWEDVPNYVDCTIFGARADSLAKILHKGIKVAIEGKLRWSQWESDGKKHSKLEVIVDELELMTANQHQPAPPQYAPQGVQYAPSPQYAPANQYGQPQYQQPYAQPLPGMQPYAPQPAQAAQQAATQPSPAPQTGQYAQPPQPAPHTAHQAATAQVAEQVQQTISAVQQQGPESQPSVYDEDIPF